MLTKLRNYITDRINRVREKFSWDAFEIKHYHGFLKGYIEGNALDNPLLYEVQEEEKYDTIFIDEIQDYKKVWVENIKKFLRDPDQGLIVFGDEKQNIYDREMVEDGQQKKVPYTSIRGQWNLLNENYRLSSEIGDLVKKFQIRLRDKYEISEVTAISQDELSFGTSEIQYHFFSEMSNNSIKDIVNISNNFIKSHKVHEGDVCFLSEAISSIRMVDQIYTENLKKKTTTTFESQEIFDNLKQKYCLDIPISIDEEKNFSSNISIAEVQKLFLIWMEKKR